MHEEIVVTGTADPVPLQEADRSVTVLPMERLLSSTVADTVRLDPSLDVRARAPGGIQTDISIRGASSGQTLVLVDGRRVNDPQTGHHNMDLALPVDSIDRVEVLRGSGSTLYGSDAVGGVINVITRRPEATELRIRTAVGNFGVNQQRITAATAIGPLDSTLSLERDFSSGFQPGRDYRNLAAASTSHLRTALGTSSLTLGYSDRPFGADQFYGNYNSWENTKTWFASLHQDLGDDMDAAFSYRRHSDLYVLERFAPWIYTNHHSDQTFDGSLRRRDTLATNSTLHYGIEAYDDTITSTNLGTHDRGRAAGYATFDTRAWKRFSFSAGAREEVWRWVGGQLSPTVAGGAWLSPRWKLRASASRSFRVPTYTELYYQDPANIGSPDLKPETAWTYEGGADYIPRDSIRLSAGVFNRRESNNIDYVRESASAPWRAVNVTRLNFVGTELSATFKPVRGQQIGASFTAIRGSRGAMDGMMSMYTFNYPSANGVLTWQGSLGRGFIAYARVAGLNRRGREPYSLIDLRAAYSRGRFRPFLALTNIGNTRYEEIAGVVMPRRGIVGGVEVLVLGK